MTLTLRLPLPPSVNGLYANIPGKGRVKSKLYRSWLVEAGWEAKSQIVGHRTIDGPVSVSIALGANRGDLDNRAKALLDLLTSLRVWHDDKQVSVLSLSRADVAGCVVTVEAA